MAILLCGTCRHFRENAEAAKLARFQSKELRLSQRDTEAGLCTAFNAAVYSQNGNCKDWKYNRSRDTLVRRPPLTSLQPVEDRYTISWEDKDGPQSSNAPTPTFAIEIRPVQSTRPQNACTYTAAVTCSCGWRRVEKDLADRERAVFVGIETAKRHTKEAHPPTPELENSVENTPNEPVDGARFRNVERNK